MEALIRGYRNTGPHAPTDLRAVSQLLHTFMDLLFYPLNFDFSLDGSTNFYGLNMGAVGYCFFGYHID